MPILSKTTLQAASQCPRMLWFKTCQSGKKDNVDKAGEFDDEMFRIGNMVGEAARRFFEDGKTVTIGTERGFGDSWYKIYAEETRTAMNDSSVTCVAEAAFYENGIIVFIDLLHRNPNGGWDIYEVKSSKQAKPIHARDASWQTYVAKKLAGVDIKNSYIMIPARGYTALMDGHQVVEDDFLVVDDWSEWIAKEADDRDTPAKIEEFKRIINATNPPEMPSGEKPGCEDRCFSPYRCDYTEICTRWS